MTIADTGTIHDVIALRPMRDGDLNFIRSSWLRSYARAVRGLGIGDQTYFTLHWEVAMGLIERPGTRVVVAAQRTDEDHLVGWACAEPGSPPPHARRAIAHYVYVKHSFRCLGLGRALLEAALRGGSFADVTATHLPVESVRVKAESIGWIFRPQFAFYLAAERHGGGKAA